MVGTSKILTVSYGTFSCTLEGFDDSFNTMKAIAEYFRGLASDDRYFGAEPPTPDAEMLAKIAEREISRRVDASMDDSGIVLRAAALTDQSDAPSDAAEAPAEPEHDKESRAKVEAERKAAKAERKARRKAARKAKRDAEREAEAAAKAEADAKAEAAEAEAKVAAEAKAAADEKAEADAKAAEQEKSNADAKADADTAAEDNSDASILSSVSSATAEQAEGTTGSDVEETRGDAPSSVLATNDPAPALSEVPAHPDADSVAAKLQRIRAVVGNSDDDENAATDDLTAQFLPQTETPDVADVRAPDAEDGGLVAEFDAHEAEMDQEAQATEQDSETPVADGGGSDMISRVMGRHAEDAPEENATPETASIEVEEAVDVPAQTPNARVVRMKRSDFEDAVENGDLKAPEAETPSNTGPDFGLLDGADELDEYLEDSDFSDTALTESETSDLDEDLAAIEADFAQEDDGVEAVEPEEEVAEVDDANTLGAISTAMNANAIIPEAPASDELAEETEDVVEDEEEHEVEPAKSAFLSEEPQVDDEALDRLMSESEAQMQEPEGSRRRDAIAQLKAAVAAKEAARQVGDTQDDAQDAENAFRDDLSQAAPPESGGIVRPRPVVRSSNRTERPRPAPLKLVAAQRVDMVDSEKRDTPIIPRRVVARTDADAAQQPAGSFAEFAENMGASELPDLLEAAAAYTAFVEGADEFSRPQILRRARTVASDDFNREDGLRSFADLLRAGRFTKVRNGRFQVADDSRFNPERRAS
ncbi:hypothetical protein SAMN05444287_0687 [Octadecabacter temperatus]|uniref:Uncharacterized protein n=1 Tax=Octadecabacter temperatus TaxID=1458307 RepID=A0A0K0Y3W5_9RHOB|nr:hypothetical protein [Octadecabacter temperatus]AKS45591.1 hypothetical protein OSB_10330 [Octadecabacter temperatus]SIN96410.1 hypothetical protein SAMN05444287_0687 [Octadecabacter temperatus]